MTAKAVKTYSPAEWIALDVAPQDRVVPLYRQHNPNAPDVPTEGPTAAEALVPELRPQAYRFDGSIAPEEVQRLLGVVRERLADGDPIFIGHDRPEPTELFGDPVRMSRADVEREGQFAPAPAETVRIPVDLDEVRRRKDEAREAREQLELGDGS